MEDELNSQIAELQRAKQEADVDNDDLEVQIEDLKKKHTKERMEYQKSTTGTHRHVSLKVLHTPSKPMCDTV